MKTLIALLTVCCLVDLSQAGKKVSLNQFGIFLEEINHAGDDGLYAELVRSDSLAETPTLNAWAAVRAGCAKVMFLDYTPLLSSVKS